MKKLFFKQHYAIECFSLFSSSQSTIPAEFAQADYLLSDANAKHGLSQVNKLNNVSIRI